MSLKFTSRTVFASTLALAVFMCLPSLGRAQSSSEEKTTAEATPNTSTAKMPTTGRAQPEIKEGEKDVDEVITNKKLRAETGSKSKYSFSTSLAYYGGTVNDPGSSVRPNIAAATFAPDEPYVAGSIGAKYKLSGLQSLSANVGVLVYKPFHSDPDKDFGQRANVSNPSLSYQVVYKTLGLQNVSSLSVAVTTDQAYRAIGDLGGIGLTQTMIYDFGGSRFSAGLAASVSYTPFDIDSENLIVDQNTKKLVAAGTKQADYAFAFYPFAEFTLSDRFNLRTVARPFNFQHRRSDPIGSVRRNVFTQSFGLGISITRDIFLYPNVQFAPEDLRAERTNVGMSLNLNI